MDLKSLTKNGTAQRQALDSRDKIGRDYSRSKSDWKEGKKIRPVEITTVSIVITIVLGLLLIPIIVFYLPLPQVSACLQ